MSFWAHLDVLRGALVRCVVALFVAAVVVFCLREWVFSILFAPSNADFAIFRWFHLSGITDESRHLISTELTAQFMTHVQVSLWVGFLLTFPYVVFELYRFVSPAFHEDDGNVSPKGRHWHGWILLLCSTVLFFFGVAVNYFIIFPFAYQFLIHYQVHANVENMITLSSYIGNLVTLSLIMGVLFEIPMLSYILARLGWLESSFLRRYHRHAIVAILIVAAIITPTGDAFTLLLVSVPIYLLYLLSTFIVYRVNR